MKPTRWSVLLAVAVVVGSVTYLLLRAIDDSLLYLPTYAPAGLAVVAIIEGFLALGTRNRLAGKPGTHPIDPLLVARYAALAKASSLVGAIAVGGYAAVIGYVTTALSLSTARTDAITAGASILSGLALIATAYALERTCRVKPPSDRALDHEDAM
jgi:hypothetical protein